MSETPCLQGHGLQRDDRRDWHVFLPRVSFPLLRRYTFEGLRLYIFIQFTLMYFKGFRAPNYASSLVLIVGELFPIKVGREWFGPGGDNHHDLMSRGCYLDIQISYVVCIVFGGWGVIRSALPSLLSPCHTTDGLKSHSTKVLGGTGSRLAPIRARMSAA